MPQSDAEQGRGAQLLILGGMHISQITRELGVSRSTVYRWLTAARLEDRQRRPSPRPAQLPRPLPWFPPPGVGFTPETRCLCGILGPPPLPWVCCVCFRSDFDAYIYRPKQADKAKPGAFRPHTRRSKLIA